MRIDDLDAPRVVPGAEAQQLDDLLWLGLDWDEGPDRGGPNAPYRQSERSAHYAAALDALGARDHLYLCDCSRAEIGRLASAPHAGDDGPPYPGTCRARALTVAGAKRPPTVRLRVPDTTLTVVDAVQQPHTERVAQSVGDFVLRRGDGIYTYQLASVVDDLAMGITEIVRGADLLSSTARQCLLAERLGGQLPPTLHIPLLVDTSGARLAKRAPGMVLRDHRRRGTPSEVVIGALAHALGLQATLAPVTATSLLPNFARDRLPARPTIPVPATLAALA